VSEERTQLLKHCLRLHTELAAIRFYAKRLPYDHMDRWRYSVRAVEIEKEMRVLTDKYRQIPT
jgi:hypothetical protein